ncbi:hypothetical protein [Streptomyces sp. NPDC090022]|uniref:hypothetical protein n=1 Tax=Streptomyces sp. NPDC090022 TaxID=3365920 RepID=UPI00382E13E3
MSHGYGQRGASGRAGRGRGGGGGGCAAGCAPLLVLPFVLAARLYRPARPDRIVDPAIERAQIARTVIGLSATLWLVLSYPLREGAGAVLEDKLVEVILTAGLLLIVGPLALTAFVMAARPPGRAFYRGRLRGPLTALGTLCGTAAAFWFLVGGGRDLPAFDGGWSLVLTPLLGLLALFSIPFTLASAVLCVHYAFRTADVHEVLPPLISPVLVWVMSIGQLFDDAPVHAPLAVRVLFLLGPPLSVTALSAWELRRLRAGYGITVRGALGRSGSVSSSAPRS